MYTPAGMIATILCFIITIYIIFKSFSAIDQYEKEPMSINDFYVYINSESVFGICMVAILTALGQLAFICTFPPINSPAALLGTMVAVSISIFPSILLLQIIKQKLIIKENQITYVSLWGTETKFTFESIKKIELEFVSANTKTPVVHTHTIDCYYDELDNYTKARTFLRLLDHYDNELCNIGINSPNMELLIERLRNANVIGIDRIVSYRPVRKQYNAIGSDKIITYSPIPEKHSVTDINKVSPKTSMPEKKLHPESNKFVVNHRNILCTVLVAFLFTKSFLVILIIFSDYSLFRARDYADFLFLTLFVFVFLFIALDTLFYKITYSNGAYEYREFMGLKRKFKAEDILYVKALPNVNIVNEARIFLKNGYQTGRISKDKENFDLLIETLKREGAVFK